MTAGVGMKSPRLEDARAFAIFPEVEDATFCASPQVFCYVIYHKESPHMDDESCMFCRKLQTLHEVPTEEIVWEFPHSVALLGTWQFFHGYCVLVSRRHATELSQLSAEERHGYLDEMCRLAAAIEKAFRPHKLNYELLGNQVPHLHWHVFPRSAADPQRLHPVWLALERAERDAAAKVRLQTGPLDRRATTSALREALK